MGLEDILIAKMASNANLAVKWTWKTDLQPKRPGNGLNEDPYKKVGLDNVPNAKMAWAQVFILKWALVTYILPKWPKLV